MYKKNLKIILNRRSESSSRHSFLTLHANTETEINKFSSVGVEHFTSNLYQCIYIFDLIFKENMYRRYIFYYCIYAIIYKEI